MRSQPIVLAILLLTLLSCNQSKDPTERRIDELIAKMTLQEKIGQLNQVTGLGLTEPNIALIKEGKVGSIINEIDVQTINALQQIAVEKSRLGIPLIFGRDVIHGFKTIFPIPLGQAATWNPKMVESGARWAAVEASSVGIRWTFGPMVDVSRDPRWGRIAESFGEDPFLTSTMGVAMVKGFQGEHLSNPTSLAACAKHFAGYGAAEAGRDYNTTWLPEVQLRDVYLPPFQAAVDAGVASLMCSFNDINGVPSSGNEHLNRQILRNEWKFNGVLVSDWGSIDQMINHGVCNDLKDAAQKALDAGVDMDMMSQAYITQLENLEKSGSISEKLIDEAVRNILRMKFRLGLFDHPYTNTPTTTPMYAPAALLAAKQTALEGVVLLKNNQALLPLKENIQSVAVIGPMSNAPAEQLGTWTFDGDPEHSVTPLAAIQSAFGSQVKIYAENGLAYSRDESPSGIEKAVAAASKAEVVLYFAGEEAILSGEAHCRADISLPGAQSSLLSALKKTGKPIVLVIMAGRPLTFAKELSEADAVLYAFHGGTMAGPALIDLILGKAVPSGKLPVTIPKMVGQVPIYYAHKMTGRPASNIVLINDIPVGAFQTSLGNTSYYLDAGDKPLFPFGFGLSYTTFRYSKVKLSKNNLFIGDSLNVECTVTNTGRYDGSEVAQLYIRDLVASLARPVRELKGFQKIHLKVGETKTVHFTLKSDQLAYWNADLVRQAEPGDFQVWISTDSQSGDPATFTLN
ncbi:MAG TPA: glycoside hydrolase family 3 N-terminal domain-containing protein [Bacteroidales bacterium]|nr:glycoside hydrolase family 3 N-terminal domain-containing protein [Bacteroidales bacterium]